MAMAGGAKKEEKEEIQEEVSSNQKTDTKDSIKELELELFKACDKLND